MVTKDNSKEPPNKPTKTKLPLFLKIVKSSFAVGGLLTKSTTLSAPLSLQIDIIFSADSGSLELMTKSAPISFAVFNFSSSKSAQIILALVIALAICTPINPKPPAPTITRNSGEF